MYQINVWKPKLWSISWLPKYGSLGSRDEQVLFSKMFFSFRLSLAELYARRWQWSWNVQDLEKLTEKISLESWTNLALEFTKEETGESIVFALKKQWQWGIALIWPLTITVGWKSRKVKVDNYFGQWKPVQQTTVKANSQILFNFR